MLKLDPTLLAKNRTAEICSVYIAPDEIEKSLAANAASLKQVARTIHQYNPDRLLLVGSGASWCSTFTGYYFLRANTTLPVSHWFGPELTSEPPRLLGTGRPLAIVASYSGKTADTVTAARFLKERSIPTVAISRDEKGPLAQVCDHAICYHSKCLYTSAMANLLALLAEWLELRGEAKPAGTLRQELQAMPGRMRTVLESSEKVALAAAERLAGEEMIYCLGDGATWALAYQFAYTHLMEYTKIHSAVLRSCEWRHGPLEVLYRSPAILMFVGNEASRAYALATRKYCERHSGKVIVFDSEAFFTTHPSLSPFALHAVAQFFLLFLNTAKGIDSEAYKQMHVHPYLEGETYY